MLGSDVEGKREEPKHLPCSGTTILETSTTVYDFCRLACAIANRSMSGNHGA